MIPYIKKIIKAFPEKITGVQSTPAGDHLFLVRPSDEAKYLPEEQAQAFHHTTAQFYSCLESVVTFRQQLRSLQRASSDQITTTGASLNVFSNI